MSIIVPHHCKYAQHSAAKYLWRITCSCGYLAFAPDEMKAQACIAQHLQDEEPFPDLTWNAKAEGE